MKTLQQVVKSEIHDMKRGEVRVYAIGKYRDNFPLIFDLLQNSGELKEYIEILRVQHGWLKNEEIIISITIRRL